ncbi:probable RIC1 protein [Cephalotrichum gorgonifer]|uniref:Probable RIC1 protein n=1 Tax=Cephalotrichum gorgonifer TaxID=2041049 RepID=A0AAE8MPY7_9PEZI|nr:probable RIC1 protein [Cephalotrichum gorgonifer]
MGILGLICIIILTLFFPPIGVFAVAGCGMDLLINVILTLLGLLPGHIHAFYILYVYYDRREQARNGIPLPTPAPGIFSQRVQSGGYSNYGPVH